MRIEAPPPQSGGSFRLLSVSTLSLFGGSLLLGALAVSLPGLAAKAALVFGIALAALGSLRVVNAAADRFPEPLAKLIHWVHALAFEGCALLAILFLHPARYLHSHRVGVGAGNGRPILLIHGYFHDSSAWLYQRHRLVQEGFGPVYTLSLGHPCRSIRDYAEKVREKAGEIERETNRKELILIGHSMGGLVSSWYATRVAPPGKVTDVITIGSPLDGTHMAKIGIGPNAREMERDSELLKELREEIEKSVVTRFYHIATKTDQLVIPHSSAIVGERPERQFIVDDIGHVALLFSPRVAQKIAVWLRG